MSAPEQGFRPRNEQEPTGQHPDEDQYQIPFSETAPDFDGIAPQQRQPMGDERVPQAPQEAPEMRRDDFFPKLSPEDERKKKKVSLPVRIGAAVTALAAGAALWVGLKSTADNDHSTTPQPAPSAGAPPVAGGELGVPSSEAAPTATPEATPGNPYGLTTENFPYKLGDETYPNREAFIKAMGISVEKYPTPELAMEALVNVGFNNWVNSGMDMKQDAEYKSYNPDRTVGTGAMSLANDFYNPAFSEALFTGAPGVIEDPSEFIADMSEYHTASVRNYVITANDKKNADGSDVDGNNATYQTQFAYGGSTRKMATGGKAGKDSTYVYQATVAVNTFDNGDKTPEVAEERSNFNPQVEAKQDVTNSHNITITLTQDGFWKIVAVS